MSRYFNLSLALALALALTAGCSSSTPDNSSGSASTATARTIPVSMNKNDYPVFPSADAGADPSVPAEQGGKGFTGKGWETNTDFDFIGDPRALKGGMYHDFTIDFPATLRLAGPESSTQTSSEVANMVYETLLGLSPMTDEYIPGLATH